MPLEPLHPDEPALHHELRDTLNRDLSNTDFFVWITVEPTGGRHQFNDVESIASQADHWLSNLDPETVDVESLPELELSDPAASVRIRAIPKKPSARGNAPGQIVGNPEPALAGWV